MSKENCHCENEAEVLYKMYKTMNNLVDGEWQTPTCCGDGLALMNISGKTLSLTYADGTQQTYTDPS